MTFGRLRPRFRELESHEFKAQSHPVRDPVLRLFASGKIIARDGLIEECDSRGETES
jgi:hypothetical protein